MWDGFGCVWYVTEVMTCRQNKRDVSNLFQTTLRRTASTHTPRAPTASSEGIKVVRVGITIDSAVLSIGSD